VACPGLERKLTRTGLGIKVGGSAGGRFADKNREQFHGVSVCRTADPDGRRQGKISIFPGKGFGSRLDRSG
jgi:hypothetical protein